MGNMVFVLKLPNVEQVSPEGVTLRLREVRHSSTESILRQVEGLEMKSEQGTVRLLGGRGKTGWNDRTRLKDPLCHPERSLAESKDLGPAQLGNGSTRCFALLSMTIRNEKAVGLEP